jgi:hypothetical protein
LAISLAYPSGGGGYFTPSNDFYLPSLHLEEGAEGVSALWEKLIFRKGLEKSYFYYIG